MIQHELLSDRGILIVKPQSALSAEDFTALARAVDPYIEQHGGLKGLMIDAPAFPGWESFAGLLSHLRFVRDHQRLVRRIAVVSDSAVLSVLPRIASHFVSAEVHTFDAAERAKALAWIEGGNQP